jgi:hypothetical protein
MAPTADKIDHVEYLRGYSGFKAGGTLRTIVAGVVAADSPREEDKAFARVLGFADAFFDQVRGIDRRFADDGSEAPGG